MSDILAWGLDVVRLFQRAASPGLTAAMKAVTFLGTEYFYLAALPLLYWCVDKRRATRLGLVFLASSFCNSWLKVVFAQPRPFQLDPTLGLASETSYGLPSGHAQGSATFWGLAARFFKKPWGLVLALALPLVVGLSRVYLGVHFPTDLFLGWALGALFVGADLLLGERAEAAISKLRPTLKIALAAAAALAMNALYAGDTSLAGVFLGFAAGLAYAPKVAPFSAGGPWAKRLLRFAFGLATVAIVYFGPKLFLGSLGSDRLVRFIRYAAVGAWCSIGAPWLFLVVGLADREPCLAEREAAPAEAAPQSARE